MITMVNYDLPAIDLFSDLIHDMSENSDEIKELVGKIWIKELQIPRIEEGIKNINEKEEKNLYYFLQYPKQLKEI